MKKLKHFGILLLYIFLTIIFTYPVAFSDDIPGDGGDAYQHLWYLWWWEKSLLSFNSPYDTTYIFYPTGVNLAFNAMHPINSIMSIPFQEIFGLIWTYKILWLMSFFIAGYGTYLLVRYLTDNNMAAFISGLIFMFAPSHFAHGLGHFNIIVIEWIPFYILYLYKTIKEDKLRNPIYAAFFLFLTSTEYYYFIYLSFFTIIFLLYNQFTDNNILKKSIIKRISIMLIIFGLIYLPFVYPLLKELITSKSDYMYAGGHIQFSADILGFFIPAQFHPIFGEYVTPIYKNFTGNRAEHTVFTGYTVLFLAILAILKIKNREIKFWSLSAIIFFLFTLGPILHINGKLLDYIKLPYSIIMNLPILSIARVPSRWDVLVMISLAILAGYGLNYLFIKYGTIKRKLIIVFIGLILFEYLSIPYPMSTEKIPEFYHQLRYDTKDSAIFEIPNARSGNYMYYQTLHEKKLVNGYVSRRPPEAINFIKSTPIINQLSSIPKDMAINDNIANYTISILNYYKIRYIILHENYLKKDEINKTNILLQNISKEKRIYKEDNMVVYIVEKSSDPFILLISNWFSIATGKDGITSWMLNNATILSYSPEARYSNFSFETRSFYKPRLLEIYLNDKLVHQQIIKIKLEKINIPFKFKEGENIIRLYSPDVCQRPIDFPELKNNDTRCLSILFVNMTII